MNDNRRLERPTGKVDVVLDTDTYNEIDDQFALAYLLCSEEKLNLKAIYAAPFFNEKSSGPADGMEKSYREILKVLDLMGQEQRKETVFRGAESYLPDEKTPVMSEAVQDLVERSKRYDIENPLYVVAIGAITNIASAILLDPSICERIVVVWLGGHGLHWPDNQEFNLSQDIAGARIVFQCGVPLVQLPCMGVVSAFTVSGPELEQWLLGKNRVCDYLVEITRREAGLTHKGDIWTRVIWDVTAVAWLLEKRFMKSRLIPAPVPGYDHQYSFPEETHQIRYVYYIERDALLEDLVRKLTKDSLPR